MSSNENSNDKKYIGLESLRTFLNNLKYLFVDKTDYDSHDHNNFEEAKRYADSLSDNYEAAGSIITAIGEIPKGDGDEPIASNVVGYVDIKVDELSNELSNEFSTAITKMYGGEIPEDNFTIQEIAEEKAIKAVNSAFEVANGIYVVKEEGKSLSTNDLTDVLKSHYDDAYNHSVEPHAPANAQENIIESIKVNDSPLAITTNDKSVNISIPTDYVTSSDISNLAEKATTLSGYGITDAYTKSEVDQLDAKVNTLIGAEKAKDENGNDTDDLLDANKSVRTIANEELTKQLVPESAIESLDTLTEIAAWIQSHPDSASAMNEEISKLISKTALGTYSENGSVKEYNTVKAYVESMIDLEEARADEAYDKNIIESIKINGSALAPSNDKSVNITIPTDNASLTNGAGYLTSSDISGKADKSTTLGGYGIINAYTKTEVNGLLDNKVSKENGRDLSTNDLTDTLKSNYDDAYKHSQDEHAPVNSQENVIESIKVNGTDLTVSSKSVNITIPTDNASFTNSAGYLVASDIAAKANKSTTLAGYGIINAYTKSEVDSLIPTDYLTTDDTYTKDEIEWLIPTNYLTAADISGKADKATTLSGYGITDVYTKTEINAKLDEKQSVITGGASTIASSNLTTNRALISNASGKVVVSDVTSTELGYLDGVTSGVQEQLNDKVSKTNSGVQSILGGLVLGGTSATATAKGSLMVTGHANPLIGLQAVDSSGEQLTPYYFQVANDIMYVGPTSTKALSFDRDGNVELPATLTVAGTISGTLSGNASSATKLTSNAGSETQPIYFSDGKPVATTYALNKTVPSDAIFTDNKVTNTKEATRMAFITGTTSPNTNTGTQIFDPGVYLDTTAGQLVATTFVGALNGNATSSTTANEAKRLIDGNDLAYNAGSETKPVYFKNGRPTELEYALNKTVPANAVFTDTKVTNTLAATTKAYVTGTTSATTKTGTQVFDTGVYLDTTAGQLVATIFKGELDGNATSATKATQDGNGKVIADTYQPKVTGMPTQFITCTTTDESQFPDVVEDAILIAYDV